MHRTPAVALTAGAVLWALAVFLTPFAVTSRNPALTSMAAVMYGTCSRICHQRPERSFRMAGVQQPVCARCAGLYLAGALGALAGWLGCSMVPRRARTLLIVAAVPTALTVGLELLGMAHPSGIIRAAAALPLGITAGCIFVRLLRAAHPYVMPAPLNSIGP